MSGLRARDQARHPRRTAPPTRCRACLGRPCRRFLGAADVRAEASSEAPRRRAVQTAITGTRPYWIARTRRARREGCTPRDAAPAAPKVGPAQNGPVASDDGAASSAARRSDLQLATSGCWCVSLGRPGAGVARTARFVAGYRARRRHWLIFIKIRRFAFGFSLLPRHTKNK